MKPLNTPRAAATLAMLAAVALPGHAASIFISPASTMLDVSVGTAVVDLLMDFGVNESTVGGGLDLDVSGPATLVGFTPSAYFSGTADPAFSGHGTERADNDLEIHFGNFNGMSGQHTLGTLTFTFNTPGTTTMVLGINSFWGGFYSVAAQPMDVALAGAQLTVTAVPEPQTVALMLLGLGLVGRLAPRRAVPQA